MHFSELVCFFSLVLILSFHECEPCLHHKTNGQHIRDSLTCSIATPPVSTSSHFSNFPMLAMWGSTIQDRWTYTVPTWVTWANFRMVPQNKAAHHTGHKGCCIIIGWKKKTGKYYVYNILHYITRFLVSMWVLMHSSTTVDYTMLILASHGVMSVFEMLAVEPWK